jgi:TolB protein
MKSFIAVLLLATSLAWAQTADLATPQEKHLRNVRQLTFGGQNAEAYFSADGKKLIFQSTHGDVLCDQIFTMNIDGSDMRMVSTGKGRTTCGFFYPDGKKILFSSTHLADANCPPRPDFSKGYVWAIYPGYDIFTASPDGSSLKQLTHTPGYDAETTISEDGKKLVFTSMRNGDLDIYSMDAKGKSSATTAGQLFLPTANGSSIAPTIRLPKQKSKITKICWRKDSSGQPRSKSGSCAPMAARSARSLI